MRDPIDSLPERSARRTYLALLHHRGGGGKGQSSRCDSKGVIVRLLGILLNKSNGASTRRGSDTTTRQTNRRSHEIHGEVLVRGACCFQVEKNDCADLTRGAAEDRRGGPRT